MMEESIRHDEQRAERRRQFSRREILRAGMALPAVLSIPAVLAGCGGGSGGSILGHGDHTDASHGDHTDTGNSTTSTTSAHADTPTTHTNVHGDTPTHGDTTHNDTTTTTHGDTPHLDTAHVDTAHGDTTSPSITVHQDSGPHIDSVRYSYQDVAGPPHLDGFVLPNHLDSGAHADTAASEAGDHQDTPHGDQPHSDQAAT